MPPVQYIIPNGNLLHQCLHPVLPAPAELKLMPPVHYIIPNGSLLQQQRFPPMN